MNIHEYQAKEILKAYGVNCLDGFLIESGEDLKRNFELIETDVKVLKAQVHAGGRGKAGGVKVVKSLKEAEEAFDALYMKPLVTVQTGEKGEMVRKLFLESGCEIDREFYLSMVVNRKLSLISIIISPEGGMDIEKVADETPEKVLTIDIDPLIGISGYVVRQAAQILGIKEKAIAAELSSLLYALYELFLEKDLTMIEINPLVLDKAGKLIALDAKLQFDDNALFRHSDIEALRDDENLDEHEVEAEKYGLSYVSLDGDIGCLVNGAGLAMATMDAIKLAGGNPANFLDIGGGASSEIIARALGMVFEDSRVKAVLVNIFGGINHCDVIAEGVVMALNEAGREIPMVVRLQGMNFEEGKKIIEDSGYPIYLIDSMDAGADKVYKLAKGEK